MINQEIAKILYEIFVFMDMDDVQFKPRAFEKAALTIEDMSEDLGQIYKEKGIKGLMEIPTIGRGIASYIEEYIKTGKVKEYERLKKKFPVDLENLKKVEGLGPKGIKFLYKKLKIRNLQELEKYAKAGKLRNFEGWGEKKEQNILKGLEFIKLGSGRQSLGSVLPLIEDIKKKLEKLKDVKKVVIAGSIRRWKETVGDADILVIADNYKEIMDYFTSMPEIGKVYGKGETKSTIKLKSGMDVDLRIVPEKSYGAALNYFTGSKEHNVALRQIAKDKGLKLNEWGLFRKEKFIGGRTEEELYKLLGLRYIEPELRESFGQEIEAARNNKLPNLVELKDLKGDLQTQTSWTDGSNSIKEMADYAKKIGLKYIVITDHTKALAMTGGLNGKRILEQGKEIDKLNNEMKDFKILKGTECDILKNGDLDIEDDVLKKLDVVGISVHSLFNMPKEEMTKRICKAMRNENADILFHPTGRRINIRKAYEVDIDEVIKTAKQTKTILEIDGTPDRLDLKEDHIKKAIKNNVKLCIDSDSHNIKQFDFLKFGIGIARRGWSEKKDIINTLDYREMLKNLK
ncbi:MAG TPA: DNA polymerase/3'-5' exonuclease PolX [Candidatus Nanoarchaeia archaeon]|nr:DNA polymerase/3'-5' exonuclease PolX [Candidatus Nanoarchaeia archaeon]